MSPGWQKTAALFLFFKVQASLEPKQKKSQQSQVEEAEAEVPLENTDDTGSEYMLETNLPKQPEHT